MSRAIIAKNTISQLLGRVGVAAAGFVAAIVIARTYGVSGFGEFTTVTALISFGYLFVDFGLNASYVKLDEKRNYFTDFLLLRLLLGIVATFLLVVPVVSASFFGVTLFSITPPFFLGLFIFSFTILLQATLISYSALFQIYRKYELQAYALIPGAVVLVATSLLIGYFKLPLVGIYVSYVISGIVSVSICAYLLRRDFAAKKLDQKFARKLLKRGLPFGLLVIFNLIYFRIDTLLLSAIKGSTAVGIYGYAYRYFDFALTVPLFLSNSLYPFLLKNLKNVRKGRISEAEFFFVFLSLGILAAVLGVVLSPAISLISPGFENSALVLQILSVSLPFFFLTSYVQWLLIARDQERGLLFVYLGVACINIVLNLFFLPKYSYVAAAVITGICEGFVLALLLYKLQSTKNYRKVS